MIMNLESGFSPPPSERAPFDKDALQKKHDALKAKLKTLQSFGDAGEIAVTKKQIREVGYQIQEIPKEKWAETSANEEAFSKKLARDQPGFISEDSDIGRSRSDKPISELAREASADIERLENEEQPLEIQDVIDDVEDAHEAGETVTSVVSSEYASLKRAERDRRVAELKKVVEQAYEATTTKDVAQRFGVKLKTSRASEEVTQEIKAA